jgi:hypothetical protein
MTISISGSGLIDTGDATLTLSNSALLLPRGNNAQK